MRPNASKLTPRAPKWGRRAPKCAPRAPKWGRRVPKLAPRAPNLAPGALKLAPRGVGKAATIVVSKHTFEKLWARGKSLHLRRKSLSAGASHLESNAVCYLSILRWHQVFSIYLSMHLFKEKSNLCKVFQNQGSEYSKINQKMNWDDEKGPMLSQI